MALRTFQQGVACVRNSTDSRQICITDIGSFHETLLFTFHVFYSFGQSPFPWQESYITLMKTYRVIPRKAFWLVVEENTF